MLRKAFSGRGGRTLFGFGLGSGVDGLREALRNLLVCPMLHMPEVSKVADVLLIFIQGGTGMGMSGLQSVSKEIRDFFKAGENIVFGAHVDENLGDTVKITILGCSSLEAPIPTADVAPSAETIFEIDKTTNQSHSSKLREKLPGKNRTKSKTIKSPKAENPAEQNIFSFMEDQNQRGIFEDLPTRNMYEGEDLDVPSYLRRGVEINI